MDLKELKKLCSNFTLLYVEDDENIAKVFLVYLEKLFKQVTYKNNGKEGLDEYIKQSYDLVITDIQMPEMSGLEMAATIKQINNNQNILVVSAYSDSDKLFESIKIGIDGYILKPVDYDHLNTILFKTMSKIKKLKEHALYEQTLQNLVSQKTTENIVLEYEKVENYEQTLYALIEIIESRDTYTGKHSLRVAQYSKLIAQQMQLDHTVIEEIYKAAMLHDLGKIGIPDSLLLKPGKLTPEEFTLIKQHVNIGFHMLDQIPMFKSIASIINAHHERLDGSGYPNGLQGDKIPFGAFILAVADTFDAMTTNRIYKHRKTIKEALTEIDSLKGKHFKKEVVEAAHIALQQITVDTSINQLPHSTLEEERFSFFYKDALCHLYNETYLDFVLAKNMYEPSFSHLNLICLQEFGEYNKKFGWSKGNILLQTVANKLKDIYRDMTIFRIHGDDFIILSSQGKTFDSNALKPLNELLQQDSITIEVHTFEIKKAQIDSLFKLEKLL